jgi:hydroxymethylpyrimidine pyrophosphatase-like HAD family hydrolase
MYFHVLAVDYDGTLATDGHVEPETIAAIHRLKDSGRHLILVTGRIIEQLLDVFPEIDLCDLVVADNGAMLFNPHTRQCTALAGPPAPEFVQELLNRGVTPLEVGNVIVATWEPHETTVLQTIRDMGLELQIIFNKGAVMVLPTGVNKATGLRKALTQLGYSHHNTIGIGDAENDEAFLRLCGMSVAVDNALDVVKQLADRVTREARGVGVAELIEQLISNDSQLVAPQGQRCPLIGTTVDGTPVRLPLRCGRVLVVSQKATHSADCVRYVAERLMNQDFQLCLLDFTSNLESIGDALPVGTAESAPSTQEVVSVIGDPTKQCVANVSAASTMSNMSLLLSTLRALLEHHDHTGRPHWIFIVASDTVDRELWNQSVPILVDQSCNITLATNDLTNLPAEMLTTIEILLVDADEPATVIHQFARLIGVAIPEIPGRPKEADFLAWRRSDSTAMWIQSGTRQNVVASNSIGLALSRSAN